MVEQAEDLCAAARMLSSSPASRPVLVGFDGFVDEIVHAVDIRTGAEKFRRLDSMRAFGDRIRDAAGLSCNIELVSQMTKLGGNGPIMARAFTRFEHRVTYIGALGKDVVAPVFTELADECERVILLADPAHTSAVEFLDGKVMLGTMSSLSGVTWENLVDIVPRPKLRELVGKMELIGFLNWTMLPHMNGLFDGFGRLLAESGNRPRIFVDLADPAKRTRTDLIQALGSLGDLQSVAEVILGLNENESSHCVEALQLKATKDLAARCIELRKAIGVGIVIIHPIESAHAADEQGAYSAEGAFTPNPNLTTGAGDVFNAGFCHGLLHGCGTRLSLLAGTCTSGFYVRNCRSPDHSELIKFMGEWAKNTMSADSRNSRK